MSDPYDLQRFVAAQEAVYELVLEELQEGEKRRHWMWFIFPQLKGLGRTETARFYGISSIDEAQAYLRHPVLGTRLLECIHLLLQIKGKSVHQIFGSPDDLKLRSSLSLFAIAAEDKQPFLVALEKFYGGELDPLTSALLVALP
ncbi:DUF1810 domain-containing protein [Undibacterium terreum]|uniref:Calpastatin n=1 Tax=Undibacterium terreum TaxID=1224302 RepID=A0A916UYJ8_9BURK|nr:DUF1810 domain-containing protein [Undibacterium terreum]GGC93641.1 calpastatin [Undibacterium terreum]